MAVPTSYTELTFAEFIRDEVLGNVADTMEWGVATTPEYLTLITHDNTAVNDSIVEFTTAAGSTLGIGTKLTFAGHDQVYRVAEAGAGSTGTKLRIFPYAKVAFLAGTVATYQRSPTTPAEIDSFYYDTNPVYSAILNETLFALGYSSIAEVTGQENLAELRSVGRIEAWHSVVSNSVSFTNSDNTEGNTFNRGQVFNAAMEQLQIAQDDYGRLFSRADVGVAGLATSGVAPVRVIW